MNHSVRIIGGLYRGKKINFPDSPGLRPTPDRVKETLFNWLMQDIRGTRCLDAFAGSGALGFEAFSRGAKNVVMLESSPAVYKVLHQTVLTFNQPQLHVMQTDALHYMQHTKEIFDIIFLDPPFKSDFLESAIECIESSTCLAKGGVLYVESESSITLSPLLWRPRKLKQAGQVFYALFEKI